MTYTAILAAFELSGITQWFSLHLDASQLLL